MANYNVPENLKYNTTHEWAKIEGDVCTVGISDFAQQSLGDIVFIDLPSVGKDVKQGQDAGSIESAKAVSELKMPVSGKIIEVNKVLGDAPDTANKSCYADGWFVKIKMSAPAEASKLLDAKAYKPLCK